MKKLLAVLLSVAMVFSTVTVTALAEPDWKNWDGTTDITAGGYYKLQQDVTVSKQFAFTGDIHLDLNGKKMSFKNASAAQGTLRCDKTDKVMEIFSSVDGAVIDGTGQTTNGAIFTGGSSKVNVTVKNITFQNFTNTSANSGAVICVQGTTTALIENCTFKNNSLPNGTAAAIYNGCSNLVITGCTFEGNSCGQSGTGGGAIRNTDTLTINNSVFKKNYAIHGGAVFNYDKNKVPTLNIYGCTFEENYCTSNGGALYITNGTLNIGDYEDPDTKQVIHTTFKNNGLSGSTITTGAGGAIYLQSYDTQKGATITNAVFEGNAAKNSGGAIRNEAATAPVTLNNCTFTGNQAAEGAAFWSKNAPALTIAGGSFTGNKSIKDKASGGSGCAIISSGATEISGKLIIKDNISAVTDMENLRVGASTGAASVKIADTGLADGSDVHVALASSSLTMASATDVSGYIAADDTGLKAVYDGTNKLIVFNKKPEVQLDKTKLEIEATDYSTIKATVLNTEEKAIFWETSDDTVADIIPANDGSTARITAKKEGKATIKASLDADTSIYASCEVTVTPFLGNRVELDRESVSIKKDLTETLVAVIKPSKLSEEPITWTSKDEKIATVVDGVVTAVGVGETDITAKLTKYPESKEAVCHVEVVARHMHDEIEYIPWNSEADANYKTKLPTKGNYYLTSDVTLGAKAQFIVNGELNLCLNGHKITTTSSADTEGVIRLVGAYKVNLISPESTATVDMGNLTKSFLYNNASSTVGMSVSGIRFENYNGAGQAISLLGDKNTFTDCEFKNVHSTAASHSAIYITKATTMTNCTFDNCSSSCGGVIDSGAKLTFVGCTFKNNTNRALGGEPAVLKDVDITDCTFENNSVAETGNGGAILNISGTMNITNTTFKGNHANNGGAIYQGYSKTTNIYGCNFEGNYTINRAGAVYVTNGLFMIDDATDAASGEKIHTTFTGNGMNGEGTATTTFGGAINYQNNASMQDSVIKNAVFTGNVTQDASNTTGGAILNDSVKKLTLDGCTFTGNKGKNGSALTFGGAASSTVVKDCTMTGNIDYVTTATCGAIYIANKNKAITLEGENVIKDNVNSAATPIAADLCLQANADKASNCTPVLKNPTANTDVRFNFTQNGGAYTRTFGDTLMTLDGSFAGSYKVNSFNVAHVIEAEGNNVVIKESKTGHNHDGKDYVGWTSTTSLPSNNDIKSYGSNFYLTSDVTVKSAAALTGVTLNLCLNGHTVYVDSARAYRISADSVVTISSCKNGGFKRIGGPMKNGTALASAGIIGVFTDAQNDNGATQLTLKNLSFKGADGNDANGGGALAFNAQSGKLTIDNCTFDGFYVTQDEGESNGGALFVSAADKFVLKNSKFTNNYAKSNGGAVYIAKADAVIEKCEFTKNNVKDSSGGALCTFQCNEITIKNSTFKENSAVSGGALNVGRSFVILEKNTMTYNSAKNGGAVVVSGHDKTYTDGKILIKSGTFNYNKAENGGGVLFLSQPTEGCVEAIIENGDFSHNEAGVRAGAICSARNDNKISGPLGAKLTINNGTFTYNKAGNGGVIMAYGETIIHGGEYSNNTATIDGAAIYATGIGVTFKMDGGVVKNNKVYKTNDPKVATSGRGGGVMIWGRGEGEDIGYMKNVTITNNYAENYAAGMYVGNGIFEVTDTKISNNTSGSDSAGFAVGGKAVLTIGKGTVVSNNRSKLAAGCAIQKGAKLIVNGAKFSGNRATAGNGSAIYLVGGGLLNFKSGSVTNNSGQGTAVCINGPKGGGNAGYISGATFSGNTSDKTDGACIWASEAIVSISNSKFINNKSLSAAGAVNARGKSRLTINNCTFTDNQGRNGGAIVITSGSSATMNNCHVERNKAEYNGGGIYLVGNATGVATLNMKNCTVNENDAMNGTAGAINIGGIAKFENVTISKNHCKTYGGALYPSGEFCDFTMIDSEVSENVSDLDGGGMLGRGKAKITLKDVLFTKNEAATHGGAMLIQSYATVDADGVIYDSNKSGGTGGAVRTTDNEMSFKNCKFINNFTTGQGGAMYLSGPFVVENCIFDNNRTDGSSTSYEGQGGAFTVNGGHGDINNCSFTNNSASGGGGAFASLWSKSKPVFNGCTFEGNMTNAYGGAMLYYKGTESTINDSTFKNNTSGYAGGAISLRLGPTLHINKSTFDGNSGPQGGAFSTEVGNILYLNDTVIKNNRGSVMAGAIYSLGNTYLDNVEITGNTSGSKGAVVTMPDGNDRVLNVYGSKLVMSNKIIISDNEGGDLYNSDKVVAKIVNEKPLTADSKVYVEIEKGVISSNIVGPYDYEKLSDLHYVLTAGDRSFTEPEAFIPEGGDQSMSTGALVGIIGGGVALIAAAAVCFIIIGKKRKKEEK